MLEALGVHEGLMLFFLAIILLGGTLFWVWIILDCAMNEPKSGEKLPWLLLIIVTHLLGAVIYFAVRRPRRIKEYGR